MLKLAVGILYLLLGAFGQVHAETVKLGLAYDVTRDGHGFDLHKVGDTYILFFYTYDSKGDPEWLLGVGTLEDGVISGALDRYLYDYNTPSSQFADSSFAGTFRLDASAEAVEGACNDGVERGNANQLTSFFWQANDRSGVWCTQFLFGGDDQVYPYHGGVWFAGEDDAGYGFSMSHEGDTLAAVVYYFDGEGQPRWSLGIGPANEVIELDHYEGYCRTCPLTPRVTQPAGSLELVWNANQNGDATYGVAALRLNYPVAPFGSFNRDFELHQLSDGTAVGQRTPQPMSTQAFYSTFISPFVVQDRCINCHVEGGPSGQTRLVFNRPDVPDYQALNLAMIGNVVEQEGADYILNKIRGGNGHGGGVQVPGNSLEYADMELFFSVMTGESSEPKPNSDLFNNVAMLPWDSTLRKAALLFAGRLPTQSELQVARGNNEGAFRNTLRNLMNGPNFKAFLTEGANDRLLTDKWLEDDFVNARFNELYPEYNRMVIQNYLAVEELVNQGQEEAAGLEAERIEGNLRRASAREPIELIAHVVMQEKPYTELLTANYTLVNPILAEAYAADASFTDSDDLREWREGRNRGQVSPNNSLVVNYTNLFAEYVSGGIPVDMPHAGVLNTPAFLARYPSTATNRNRARARWTYYFFLGVDIEEAASRPTDPAALADRNNPTLNNPVCAVCHQIMDPVAGTFQNYGDVGMYRDQFGGRDSLPETYKHESGSPYRPGDTWYRDMRTPGFNGKDAPNAANSLQWLAQQITADPRFTPATVKFWWPAVIGRMPLRAPQQSSDTDYPVRLAAFEAQNGYIEDVGARFRNGSTAHGAHNLKDLLVDLVMGPWFRASGLTGPISDEQTELLDLAEVSGERLLTPEQLERKIKALTGFVWQEWDAWGRPGETVSALRDHHKLSYGGIDSDGITRRQTEMTSVMSTVVSAFAAQSACSIIAQDVQRPDDQRLLFQGVEPSHSPFFEGEHRTEVSAASYNARETVSLTVPMESGPKRLNLAFLNDYSEGGADRNLYVSDLQLLRGNQVLKQFNLASVNATPGFENTISECNGPGSEGFTFYCQGSISIPFDLTVSDDITVRLKVYADLAGPELPRLALTIEADDPLAETATSIVIREMLVRWFDRLFGEAVSPHHDEVERVYGHLVDTWQWARDRGNDIHHIHCADVVGGEGRNAMLTAWQSTLVWFLTDYRFLYE